MLKIQILILIMHGLFRGKTPDGSWTPMPVDDSDSSDEEIPYSKFGNMSCVDESSTDDASETEEAIATQADAKTPPRTVSSSLDVTPSVAKSAVSLDTSATLTGSPDLGSPVSQGMSPNLTEVSKYVNPFKAILLTVKIDS